MVLDIALLLKSGEQPPGKEPERNSSVTQSEKGRWHFAEVPDKLPLTVTLFILSSIHIHTCVSYTFVFIGLLEFIEVRQYQ